MASALEDYVDSIVNVVTCDGRVIVGVLRGFDQTINLILEDSHERVFSTSEGITKVPLGLYVIRGDNVTVVGELDEDKDVASDHSKIKAEPLKAVTH